MKRVALIVFVLAVITAQPRAQTQTVSPTVANPGSAPIRSMLNTYCIACHSGSARAGGVDFSGISLDAIGENAEIWEKTVQKLRGRLMPPPGSRQPDQAETDAFERQRIRMLPSVCRRASRAPAR